MTRLAEGVLDDVTNYFQEHIAIKLQVLNAEYADGIELEVPKKWAIAEEDLEQAAEWPTLLIMVPHVLVEQYSNQSVENVYDILFGVILMEQDIQTLKRKLYRYGRAIFELIIEGGKANSGMGWFPVSEFTMDFQSIYVHQDTFVSDAQISVKLKSRNLETLNA